MNKRLINVIKKVKFYLAEPCCQVGFIIDNQPTPVSITQLPYHNKIRWISNPKDGWYADPFILDEDDGTITLLVEHFSYHTQIGVLDKVIVNKNTWKVTTTKKILDCDTHLSFPNILRIGDEIYVYPENSQSNTLTIYRYDIGTDSLVEPKVLVNEALLDSCIELIDGKYYIFATKQSEDTIYSDKNVLIYRSQNLFGPYLLVQEYQYPKPYGRSAGSFLFEEGKIIRPSQNGDGGYGLEVIFSEVSMTDEIFSFSELKRIGPRKISRWAGIHTYNVFSKVVVVDGISYRRGLITALFMKLYNSLKRKK